MPYQNDHNIGACTQRLCNAVAVPRCDVFCCQDCCEMLHDEWSAHRRADGTRTPVKPGYTGDTRLPMHYGGYNSHSETCLCLACKRDRDAVPIEWDYGGHPPEFGEVQELGEDHERCFVPLSNYKANKEWPADYIG